MRIKQIVEEDFVNYREASMFLGTISCNGKCCIEAGIPLTVCQNDPLRKSCYLTVPDDVLIERYLKNPITSSIVFGGLEPFEQYDELLLFIRALRNEYNCEDTVVIYTGYNRNEIETMVDELAQFKNIIIKFGRYVPNDTSHYDEVLGVTLASQNQYAERIS